MRDIAGQSGGNLFWWMLMDLNLKAEQENTEKGQKCPYCHDAVAALPTNAQCETCGAFHHPECWETHKKCSSCGHSDKIPVLIESHPELPPVPKKGCLKYACEGLAMNDARYPKFANLCKAHGYILWKRKYDKPYTHPIIPGLFTALFTAAWFATDKNPLPLGCAVFFAIATVVFNLDDHAAPWPKKGKFRIKQDGTEHQHLFDTNNCGGCGDPIDSGQETETCSACKVTQHVDCKKTLHVCPGCDLARAVSYIPSNVAQELMKNPPKRREICEHPGCIRVVIPWDGRSMQIDKCEIHAAEYREELNRFLGRAIRFVPVVAIIVAVIVSLNAPNPMRGTISTLLGGVLVWGFFLVLKHYYATAPNDDS